MVFTLPFCIVVFISCFICTGGFSLLIQPRICVFFCVKFILSFLKGFIWKTISALKNLKSLSCRWNSSCLDRWEDARVEMDIIAITPLPNPKLRLRILKHGIWSYLGHSYLCLLYMVSMNLSFFISKKITRINHLSVYLPENLLQILALLTHWRYLINVIMVVELKLSSELGNCGYLSNSQNRKLAFE